MDLKNTDKIEVEKREDEEEEEEETTIDPQNPADPEGKKKKKKKKKKAAKKATDDVSGQTATPAPAEDKKAEEDGEESGDEKEENHAGGEGEAAKKKKKKKKKKKTAGEGQPVEESKEEPESDELPPKVGKKFIEMLTAGQEIKKERAQDNSIFRVIGSWKEGPTNQTNPPTIRVDDQFPNKKYPEGEIQPYKNENSYRTTNAELREREKLMEHEIQNMRKAAECHRQVRKWVQSYVRPGVKLLDVCEKLEDLNRYLVGESGLKAGIGFPTGVNLNNIAAHYSPNPGDDDIVLGYDDVCKIDFGTHVEGRIIDCAFTVAFNPVYDNLLTAVKEATNAGIREAGIDARMKDIGAVIQETMESYEVEINGRTYPIKSIRNLNGHSIDPYKIHGSKQVPMSKVATNQKMEEGELYAIETFGSTGKGWIAEDGDCSHFMKNFDAQPVPLRHPKAKSLLRHINETYTTLPFCRRWLDRAGETGHILALKNLVNAGVIDAAPPLVDVKGSYIAQFEHTFLLKPTGKEVFSRGDDY